MALYHMDVSACDSARQGMLQTSDEITRLSEQLQSAVNGMVGQAWVAPGAQVFQTDLSGWSQNLLSMVESLRELAALFDAEIQEWEQVASTYG